MVILFCYVHIAFAQIEQGEDYWTFSKGINQGLSQNMALSMDMDMHKRIWIGTLDGLNVFDGQVFKQIEDPYKNQNNFYIVKTDSNLVWTLRNTGYCIYDFEKETWTLPRAPNKLIGLEILGHGKRLGFLESKGLVWVSDSLNYELVLEDCYIEPKLNKVHIKYHKASNRAYILAENGLMYMYDLKTKECRIHPELTRMQTLFVDLEIVEDSLYLISHNKHIFKVDIDLNTFINISEKFSNHKAYHFVDLHYDNISKNLWLSADRAGVFKYNLEHAKWTQHRVRIKSTYKGDQANIFNVRTTTNGKIYMGSTTDGLLIHDPLQQNFYSISEVGFQYNQFIDLKLPRKLVHDHDGKIWIGTSGQGLWCYETKTGQTKHFTMESHPQLLRSNRPKQLLIDGDYMWIGYSLVGVDLVNLKTLKIEKSYHLKNDLLDFVTINDFAKSLDGTLWVATNECGLFSIFQDKISHWHTKNSILASNTLYNLKRINGILYLTPFRGIFYRIDEQDHSIALWENDLTHVNYTIKCIAGDSLNNIWVGTGGSGIFVLDQDGYLKQHFNLENNTLLNNELCNFLADDLGNMWAGSNRGLTHFIHEADSFKSKYTYTYSDGLNSSEFMTGAYAKLDSTLWMGTIDGIQYWIPQHMEQSKETLPLYLKRVQSNDQILAQNIFNTNHTLTVKPIYSNLRIDFSTIGFVDGQRIKYQYRILNFKETWSNPTFDNVALIGSLPPGNYTFQLKSTNYDGVWNEKPFELKITMQAHFYETWWFIALSILGFTAILYFLIKKYINHQLFLEQEKNHIREELNSMKMQALKAQINPHFLFNTMNSINYFIINNEKTIASSYLVKFSKLIRKILYFTSKENIQLSEEIDTLEMYIEMEQMRLSDSFDYFININIPSSEYNAILVPPLTLQPFVENAIWHGLSPKEGEKSLSISISKEDNMIKITIDDNGVGRDYHAGKKSPIKKRSFGMDITQKRIQLWQNSTIDSQIKTFEIIDKKDEQHQSLGTTVHVYFPLKY